MRTPTKTDKIESGMSNTKQNTVSRLLLQFQHAMTRTQQCLVISSQNGQHIRTNDGQCYTLGHEGTVFGHGKSFGNSPIEIGVDGQVV